MSYEESEVSQNPYAAPQVEPQAPSVDESRGPEGIGGWLILPLLGLILTVLGTLAMLVTQHIPAFTEGYFARLTDPDFVNYHPLWGPVLIIEMIGNILIGVLAVWALVLLFRKASAFPRFMIVFYTVNLLFVLTDTALCMQIPDLARENGAILVRQTVQACVGAAIWIPYMRMSKRVKNTFVN